MATAIPVFQFRKAVKAGKLAPIYAATGGEPLLLDEVLSAARDAVDEATRDFNLDVFYGDDVDASSLASALAALPMMAERRSVLVKRAESLTPTVQNYLLEYAKHPVESTLLVLLFEAESKKAWIQKLLKEAVEISCKTPSGKSLRDWVTASAERLRVSVSPEALEMMTEGRNLRLIDLAAELEKAALLIEEGGEIDLGVIQQVWGIEPEVDIWTFFDRVASGQRLPALRDLDVMRESMEKDASGFVFSQVARRWRLAWKEKGYDLRRVPFAAREWSGNTKWQWQKASAQLKSLPQPVSEHALERMLDLDRTRKTQSLDDVLAFERLLHRTALEREGGGR